MAALDSPGVEADRRPRVGTIVVTLALLAGLTWVVFTSVYSPIRPNGVGGVRGAMTNAGDGIEWTRWDLTGPVGGTGEVLIGLENDGPLPIRLLGDGFEADLVPPTELSWAPDLSPRDRLAGGYPDEVRPFPVTLRPGEQVTLVIKVTKQGCTYDGGGAGGPVFQQIPLRWSVLGRERTHRLDTEKPDTGMRPITVCPREAR